MTAGPFSTRRTPTRPRNGCATTRALPGRRGRRDVLRAPPARVSELWVERTPPDFVFDIKAHALLTGQPTETKRLPKALREALPATLAEKPRLYAKDLPGELLDEVWQMFAEGLEPLAESGPAGRGVPAVPEVVLHLVREPRRDPEAQAALARRAARRRRVPQRVRGSTRRTSSGRCASSTTTSCRW